MLVAMHGFITLLLIGHTGPAQTVTETFTTAKLSASEIRGIIAAVDQTAYDTPNSWEKELRVRKVDLGESRGLVVRGTSLLCGATGNCQMWVFRMTNDGWMSLFEDAPIAEAFAFGPSVTDGIKDLTITKNLSAQLIKRTRYRFDGTVYRQQQ